MKPECYVFDLDGTLFDNSARVHLIPDDPSKTENWTVWNRACHLDELIPSIAGVVHGVALAGYHVAYVTSRCSDGLFETSRELIRHGLPHGPLLMREINDNRSAIEVKKSLFSELSKTHEIITAFEDQPQITAGLRDAGYVVIQV